MKLLALQEASPPIKFPMAQELFARIRKDKRATRNITQEDVGKFAAWLDVEVSGGDKQDLKRIIWEGITGLKDDPQGVEKVFSDFMQGYTDDSFFEDDPPEWLDEAKEDAFEELVDDFFNFATGGLRR